MSLFAVAAIVLVVNVVSIFVVAFVFAAVVMIVVVDVAAGAAVTVVVVVVVEKSAVTFCPDELIQRLAKKFLLSRDTCSNERHNEKCLFQTRKKERYTGSMF